MEENTLPKRNTPRDLFLHLLAVVTLYWSSVTFVGILWQFINKIFPDVLRYSNFGSTGAIRFFVSSLIIVFPVYLLVTWYLNNIYRREAVVRESKIRKWLIYLTLFVAALVIIVDLVVVINKLMEGETAARFFLKALSVFAVAGFIFGYYLDDVRRETPTKSAKYFAMGTGILVLVAIIGGIIIAGTPSTARLENFDQQKVFDLQNLEYQINDYYQVNKKLPESLSDINNAPQDPQPGFFYEYTAQSQTNFQLCATFNFSNQEEMRSAPESIYIHKQGRNCFERTINRLLYPVEK